MSKTAARKPLYRMVTFWLSILLVLYGLVGFVILPHYVKSRIPKELNKALGWHVSLGDVSADPFSLSLTISQFDARDAEGKDVVRFRRLYQNLSFWSLLRGVIDLQQVELDQPFVRVDLLKGYGVNFVRDWQAQHKDTAAKQTSGGKGGLPLILSHLVIKDGHIRLRDFSQPQHATFDFQPVALSLNHLATYSSTEGQGQYQLTAQMPDNQSIQWSGKLSLLPFNLQGTLRLHQLTQKLLWHFAAAHLPYQLQAGTLSLNTHFQIDVQDHFTLTTNRGSVKLSNVKVAVGQAKEPVLGMGSLDLNGIQFRYPKPDLSIAQVSSQGLDLNLVREASGQFNLWAPLSGTGQKGGSQPAASQSASQGQAQNQDGPALTWSIQHLGVSGARVQLSDQSLAQPESLQLHDIDLEADGLSDKLDQPLHYNLKLGVGSQGQLSSQGELTPLPLTVHSQFSVNQVALKPVQGYLQPYAALDLPEGTLDASGKIDLDNQNDQLTGTVSSSLAINQLKTRVAKDQSPLASWKSLKVDSIDINLAPLVVNIGQVRLNQPEFDIIRQAQGQTNIAELLRVQKKKAPATTTGADTKKADKLPVVRVAGISLTGGTTRFVDHAIQPGFQSRIHDLNGSIKGLSTVTPQKAKVALQGLVDGYGKLQVSGDIGTLGQSTNAHLKVDLNNLALPPLSPYFGRYLGYDVSKGKLDAKVNYKLDGTQLDASNRLTIDQLELGKSVNSPQAVKAPVRLGLALLRDSNNQISLDVPVKGDLSDPSFNTTGVIFHTFVNLIAKAATSPFAVIGTLTNLTGLTGEELSHLAFAPGTAEPESDQKRKLQALAQALKKRPDLILNIHAETAPELDLKALKRAQVEQAVTAKLGHQGSLAERIKVLEAMAGNQLGAAKLKTMKSQYGNSKPAQWAARLRDALASRQQLPADALNKLANRRADQIQQILVKQDKVQSSQLFLLAPDQKAAVKNGKVLLTFGLDSR